MQSNKDLDLGWLLAFIDDHVPGDWIVARPTSILHAGRIDSGQGGSQLPAMAFGLF